MPGAGKPARGGERPKPANATKPTGPGWGDRLLFAGLGLLVGCAAGYVLGESAGRTHAAATQATADDPHAGVPGAPPVSGGAPAETPGRPAIDPSVRQHLQEAEAAVRMKPGDYDALVHLGNAAYDAREFAQSIDAYERALKVRPNDPNVMTDLGTAYRNEGQVDRALEMFRRARAADPKHWQSLYNEIIVLSTDKHDHAGAEAALARLKAEHPGLPALEGLEEQVRAGHAH